MTTPALAEDNTLTDQENAEGWVLLFDGKTGENKHVRNRYCDWFLTFCLHVDFFQSSQGSYLSRHLTVTVPVPVYFAA